MSVVDSIIEQQKKYYLRKVLHTKSSKKTLDLEGHHFHHVFIVFGFSGSGKDTIINGIIQKKLSFPLVRFVRTMTRNKRPHEHERQDGFYVQRKLFDYLKKRDRFFYWYKRYNECEFGYDTLHFIFELAKSNIIMIGGREENRGSLIAGIRSIFCDIPISTIFVNRPVNDIIKGIYSRGGSSLDCEERVKHVQKSWYRVAREKHDCIIWNKNINRSIQKALNFIHTMLSKTQ